MLRRLLPFFAVAFAAAGCGTPASPDKTEDQQGMAYDYTVEYLVSARENPLVSLLPEKFTLYTKGDRSCHRVEGWMGFFAASNIVDMGDSTHHLLLKIMDRRLACGLRLGDTPPDIGVEMGDITLGPAADTQCMGYAAQTRPVISSNPLLAGTRVVYAPQPALHNHHLGGPLAGIRGLVLRFPMVIMGIHIDVRLAEARPQDLPDDLFEVPADYARVPPDQMLATMADFLPK